MDTNRFQEAIAKAEDLLVTLPKNPDFDSVAAALSLYLSLSGYGKKVNVFCPSPMLVEFNKLVGVDKISRELGNKNLTIHLTGYPAQDIERVSYNIENGEMRLAIIPKPGALSPRADQVQASFEGMSADTCIVVGGHRQAELFGEFPDLAKAGTQILISKGQRNPMSQGNAIEIAEGSSSLSETVGLLLTQTNLPINDDTAANLILGLTTATRNFTTDKVRPETFELAARLLRISKTQASQGPEPQTLEPQNDQTEQETPPADWVGPKVYKGTTLP